MIVRVSIADIDAKGLAQRARAAGIDATCVDHVGTARWGVEAGATLETVTPKYRTGRGPDDFAPVSLKLVDFIVHTLHDLREEAAYLTVDGRLAFILTAGRHTLTGDEWETVPVKVEAL